MGQGEDLAVGGEIGNDKCARERGSEGVDFKF